MIIFLIMTTPNSLNLHHLTYVVFIVTILHLVVSMYASCEVSFKANNKLYDYNLATPIAHFPHGVQSEDGFYKVVANETVLWFQVGFISWIIVASGKGGAKFSKRLNCIFISKANGLAQPFRDLCDEMIFNHDPPSCVDCKDCGGSSRCGMGCTALVAQKIGGYPVCTAIGLSSSTVTELIDVNHPKIGIAVTMSNSAPTQNCSVKVSIICDSKRFQAPQTIQKIGACDYVTQLKHPSGCAYIISSGGQGWGWFGTLMMIILCLFGAYILAGASYRYFNLGVRGIDVIPNLETWASIPHRVQSFLMSMVQRFRGPSEGYRSSYSPVNF